MPYQTLHDEKITETAEKLCRRIDERFPDSSLGRLACKVLEIVRTSQTRSTSIAQPMVSLRAGAILVALLLICSLGAAIYSIAPPVAKLNLVDFVQMLDAGTNEIILLAAAIFSIVTIETRIKRRRALSALHELRVIAHIVDMHQLTKDPERILLHRGEDTPSSPTEGRKMNAFALSRYLDYCSELLSLCGKISVLYVQRFNDPVVLEAVQDIESLTNGLSQKIWQKLMIVHSMDK